jgi:hypothetical protein
MTLTRLEQLTESLAASETISTMALQAAGAGQWFWRFDDDSLYWDDHMHEIFGTNPDDFTGHVSFFFNSVYPCDRERIGVHITGCRRACSSYTAEFRAGPDASPVLAFGKATEHYMTGICLRPSNAPR